MGERAWPMGPKFPPSQGTKVAPPYSWVPSSFAPQLQGHSTVEMGYTQMNTPSLTSPFMSPYTPAQGPATTSLASSFLVPSSLAPSQGLYGYTITASVLFGGSIVYSPEPKICHGWETTFDHSARALLEYGRTRASTLRLRIHQQSLSA
jgi:hypothetical protein